MMAISASAILLRIPAIPALSSAAFSSTALPSAVLRTLTAGLQGKRPDLKLLAAGAALLAAAAVAVLLWRRRFGTAVFLALAEPAARAPPS